MNLIPYIHTSFATPFLHYLLDNGCPAQKYVRMAKLPEVLLEQMDEYVSERYVYQMLETTDVSIEEISRELSYNSASNFSRAFRQWSGISPHEFRLQKKLL